MLFGVRVQPCRWLGSPTLILCSHFFVHHPGSRTRQPWPAAKHENMKECSTHAQSGAQSCLLPGPVTARPLRGAERGAMTRAGPTSIVQPALASCCSSR